MARAATNTCYRAPTPVRAAVTAFVERYNTTWRLEKLGDHTPIEAREAHELRQAA